MRPATNRPSRAKGSRPKQTSSPGFAARRAAADLLSAILDDGRSLDARLEAEDSPFASLAPQDRAFARAIVSVSLRRRGQIDDALRQLMQRRLPPRAGSLRRILEIAAAQILFLEVPDHAAVSTALGLADADPKARHFKPLANGVLRNLARGRDEIIAGQDAARLNTPDWLWESWSMAYGADTARAIADAHLVEPPLDVTVKADPAGWAERLEGEALPTGTVRFRPHGRIEALPGYDEGAWWVQDFAAALPAKLLGDVSGKEVLDLCAAPGGKTAQLALAGARVTAVDSSASRMRRLAANLKRLGLEAECVVADAATFDPGTSYDAVLVDAPCSATGTIRRHPDIPWRKTASDLAPLAQLQQSLLERASSLTRSGGTIAFATCSLQPEEGEEQARAALASQPVDPSPIVPGEFTGLEGDWLHDGLLRTLPHFSPNDGVNGGMDGFFAARFLRQ